MAFLSYEWLWNNYFAVYSHYTVKPTLNDTSGSKWSIKRTCKPKIKGCCFCLGTELNLLSWKNEKEGTFILLKIEMSVLLSFMCLKCLFWNLFVAMKEAKHSPVFPQRAPEPLITINKTWISLLLNFRCATFNKRKVHSPTTSLLKLARTVLDSLKPGEVISFIESLCAVNSCPSFCKPFSRRSPVLLYSSGTQDGPSAWKFNLLSIQGGTFANLVF